MSVIALGRSSSTRLQAVSAALKRAVVVDDSSTILHAVCSLLEHHQIIEIVGRAENSADAMSVVQSQRPELLLMDADMPGMSGLRTSLVLSQIYPDVTIVLMSMDTNLRFNQACHDCGAKAVIYKPRFLKELSDFLKMDQQDTDAKTLPVAASI